MLVILNGREVLLPRRSIGDIKLEDLGRSDVGLIINWSRDINFHFAFYIFLCAALSSLHTIANNKRECLNLTIHGPLSLLSNCKAI